MDGRIGVEVADNLEQLRLGGFGRQGMLDRMEAAFLGRARFRRDVDLARRILADDHHGQARPGRALGRQLGGQCLDLLNHVCGDTLSVDQVCKNAADAGGGESTLAKR